MHPIRQYRERHKMSQDRLGALVGTSGAAVSRWECGKREPRGKELRKLCEITGLPANEILNVDQPEVAQ